MFYRLVVFLACCLLTSCCHVYQNIDINDPFENVNRHIFNFNMKLDKVFLRPSAELYVNVVPKPARIMVAHIFETMSVPWAIINDLLQLNFSGAYHDWSRLVLNVFFAGGVGDLASLYKYKHRDVNFAMSLAIMGVKPGPYIVLPILGPGTTSDVIARILADNTFDSVLWVKPFYDGVADYIFRAINRRADFLDMDGMINNFSDDIYLLSRRYYMENRSYRIREALIERGLAVEPDCSFDEVLYE